MWTQWGTLVLTRADDIDEDVFSLSPPERRVRPPGSPAGRVDFVVTLLLFALNVVGWSSVLFGGLSFGLCESGGCHESIIAVAIYGFPVAVILTTMVGTGIVERRRRADGVPG